MGRIRRLENGIWPTWNDCRSIWRRLQARRVRHGWQRERLVRGRGCARRVLYEGRGFECETSGQGQEKEEETKKAKSKETTKTANEAPRKDANATAPGDGRREKEGRRNRGKDMLSVVDYSFDLQLLNLRLKDDPDYSAMVIGAILLVLIPGNDLISLLNLRASFLYNM